MKTLVFGFLAMFLIAGLRCIAGGVDAQETTDDGKYYYQLTCGPTKEHHPHGCGGFPTLTKCQEAGRKGKGLGYWECVRVEPPTTWTLMEASTKDWVVGGTFSSQEDCLKAKEEVGHPDVSYCIQSERAGYPNHESTVQHYYAVCGQSGCIYYNTKAACERAHKGACTEKDTRGPMPTED